MPEHVTPVGMRGNIARDWEAVAIELQAEVEDQRQRGDSFEKMAADALTEVERLREEIKRLAWCGQGPLNCAACKTRIEALGIEVTHG